MKPEHISMRGNESYRCDSTVNIRGKGRLIYFVATYNLPDVAGSLLICKQYLSPIQDDKLLSLQDRTR